MINDTHFDRPREKLQLKGIAALSDTELLQLIIGSGNATASVSNIARKAHRAIKKHGTAITYEQLSAVGGLGIARVSTILAAFELADRYSATSRTQILDTEQKILVAARDIAKATTASTLCITLDGAKRSIANHILTPASSRHTDTVRAIVRHLLADNAESIIIIHGSRNGTVAPSLDNLQFAKELMNIVTSLGNSHCAYYLVNQTHHHQVMGDGSEL